MNARVSRFTPVRGAADDPRGVLLAVGSAASRPQASRVPTAAEIDALCTITAAKLRPLADPDVLDRTLSVYAASLERHRRAGEINTLLRVTHFVSELAHECGGFSKMFEDLTYRPARANAKFRNVKSDEQATELLAADTTGEAFANVAYDGINGNNKPGDGYLYRGRGFIQLTGRRNYADMSTRLVNVCADLVGSPDLAAEPDFAARAAVSFWTRRNINVAADRDDVLAVSELINGKKKNGEEPNGMADRRQLLVLAKAAFYPRP